MPIAWDDLVLTPLMNVFGETCTYTPQAAGQANAAAAFQVDGVFDRGFKMVDALEGAPSASAEPMLGVRAASMVTQPLQGDRVFVPSQNATFKVKDVEPDSHGHILLRLIKMKAGNVATGAAAGFN